MSGLLAQAEKGEQQTTQKRHIRQVKVCAGAAMIVIVARARSVLMMMEALDESATRHVPMDMGRLWRRRTAEGEKWVNG